MEILVEDVVNKIKEIFNNTKVSTVETIYEKNDSDLKLIISLDKILYDNTNIIYTKIIFNTDIDKIKLTKNYFTYLYDINCEYVRIYFDNINELYNKINTIFNSGNFGDNIKILSNFIKSPSSLINIWFEKNNITNLSVINVISEKINIVPCKLLSFTFTIELNNNQIVKLTIMRDNYFIFKFEFLNTIHKEEDNNLNRLIEIIGNTLKNKLKI